MEKSTRMFGEGWGTLAEYTYLYKFLRGAVIEDYQ